jgi:asparagine synthase (glutamine-hydrolysing)
MCGICGLQTHTIEDKQQLVSQMNDLLHHRGPDGSGQYADSFCSIAMRRLAIIDVNGGDQPIFNEDEQMVLVFNGEIYNYQELAAGLRQRGHQFRTASDTETILHLYEEKREETPKYLKGMFAFCVYDKRNQSLFLARDRFGEKPLYYHYHPDKGLVFSSEIRSLLACPFTPRRLNYEALGYYLRVGLVPEPLTLFQDIHILPAGHWLRLQDGQLRVQPYYAINYTIDKTLERRDEAMAALRETLIRAVVRQSISEVPLGAFLSGGIDSSSVVAMLRTGLNQTVKSLTVRFEAAGYDESPVARETAAYLETDHQEFVVPNLAFEPDDLWRIVEHVGLPFPDSSAIPTYILCKNARLAVTVALSGDGGDELFAGYPFFRWGLSIQKLNKLPAVLRHSAAAAAGWLSQSGLPAGQSRLRQARRAFEASLGPASMLPVALDNLFQPAELNGLLRQKTALEIATGDLPLLTQLPAEAEHWSPLRRLMYYRLKHVLPARMLTKMDRMSMANSLEVRAPMLDVDVAELSLRMPDEHLIQNGTGKFILREAVRSSLPGVIFEQPKSGFGIPLHRFQNQHYRDLAQDLLLNGNGITQVFNRQQLEQITQNGLSRQRDQADTSVYRASHQLWSLMQLAAWAQRFKVTV